MANRTRAQLSTDSLGFFPNNTSQLISPQDLRDWITNGIESFVTQKDKSTFQNAFYENRGNAITATSGTTDLSLANGNFLHVTGTGPITITSFGTLPAGSRFVLCFDIAVTIQYNATTLIIPGAANIVTAAGDCIMLISEDDGNWRVISYFPGSGLPVGTVTAVTASAPLSATTGNAPNLSIPMANATTDGYLDKDDFVDFAGKQDALTLTTTGTSGPSTLIGSTLNIPQYSGGPGGITALTGDVTASGTGSVTASIANGAVDIPMLSATGTPDSTTFLRGDNQWATPSGASPTGYYAQYQSLVTQTAATSNTGYAMIFGTMDLSNQVTVVNNGSGNPTRITFANAGIYNLQFSSQFENTSNAQHDVTIWLRLNGSDVSGSAGFVQIPARKAAGAGNEGHIITSWNYLLDVSAGQYYEIVWSTSDHTAISMKFYAAGSPPPSTASVIFTVTQQAGIMAGTGITSINSLTGAAQTLSSSDMTITSSGTSHTFAIPDASASTKGLITTGAQTLSGIKTFGNGASAGELRLLEGSGSGTDYVAIKSPASLSGNLELILPDNAGLANSLLRTDGFGNLSWYVGGGTLGKFLKNYTQTTITNPVANTIIEILTIPANTIASNDSFGAVFRISLTGATAVTINWAINTTPTVGGPVLSGPHGLAGTVVTFMASIQAYVNANPSGNPTTRWLTGSVDPVVNAQNYSQTITTGIDWTVNQYIVVYSSASSPKTITNLGIQLTPQ